MTIKYVKDFEFPAKAGYTKSAARKPAKMARGGRATDAELRAAKRIMGASEPESITIREVTETIGRPDPSEGEREIPVIRRTDGERRRRPTAREQRERAGSSITLAEIEAMAIAEALRDQEEQDYLQELLIEELIGDRIERVDFNEGGSLPKIGDYEMYQPGGSQGPDSTDKRRMLAAERERMAAAQASSPAYNHDRWAETRARNFDDFLSHPANRRKQEGMSVSDRQRRLDADRGIAGEPMSAALRGRMAAAQRGLGADRGQRRLDQLAQRGAAGMPQRQYGQLDAPEQSDPGGYDAGGYDSNSYDDYEDAGYAKGGSKKSGSKKDWIQGAIKKPGALRKTLKVKKGESIPKGELRKAAKGEKIDGKKPSKKTQQRARLAETLGKMNTKKAAKGGSMRKQGYDDRLDESLGMSNGRNSQSMKARRDESKGMEKAMGKRAYSRVGTMDKAKGGRAKQGYDDRLDESLGSRDGKKSQSMKSRRDESKGMEKSMGRKAYSSVGTMDKGSKLAAVNRSTALKGFKQMGVMKRG